MHNDSNSRLIAVLEPVREMLRDVEGHVPELREYALETRLRLDREIEYLKSTHAA
jgi:hypothetical protein